MACSYAPLLEHIPSSQRRKLARSDSIDSHSQNDRRLLFSSTPPLDATVKKEYQDCDSQVTCSMVQNDAIRVEKTNANTSIFPLCPTICDVPVAVKVEDSEILLNSVDNGGTGNESFQLDFPVLMVREEIYESNFDDLDHVVLKERQRMLLARRLPVLPNPAFEANIGGLSENITEQTVEKVNGDIFSVDGKITVARDQCHDTFKGKKQFDSHGEQGIVPIDKDVPSSSTCPTSGKIKDEPWDNNEINNLNKDAMCSISVKLPDVKSEQEVHDDFNDDQVEHMSLTDRLNFLMAREDSRVNIPMSYSYLKKNKPSSPESSYNFSASAEPSSIKCARKRKKTATDSVETALEEDAPGLLQVLLDKGVFVDEIKLYGETGNDEALDESFCEDSFSELEDVITNIFSQRHSFIKFPLVRAGKGSRASYCLACLISLVEQTRHLKLQKWPVEWGWCRDLQSFIFVFHRHNRIVLERPEYGYATYFFELVQSLPVEWQVKRLVVAMKLTTCSRISIIENKALMVGEDLAEGEAKVLMEYGWTPNSGLGTMLNYRDRVVHDRKSEDTSEWRSKIGKLLIDGYLGGTIVMPNIPKRVADYRCDLNPNLNSSVPMND